MSTLVWARQPGGEKIIDVTGPAQTRATGFCLLNMNGPNTCRTGNILYLVLNFQNRNIHWEAFLSVCLVGVGSRCGWRLQETSYSRKIFKCLVAASCPTLCNPMDCSLPGSSSMGILQAGILERVAYPFSRGSFRPRNRTGVSCIAGGFLTSWAIRSDQSLSRVRLFATPWIAARQVSLSITNSRSSLRLTSIESVIPSSHLILCRPLLLLEKPPNFWGGPTITCIIYMCLSLSGPSFDDDISLLWLADLVWQQQRDSADVIKIPNKLIWG